MTKQEENTLLELIRLQRREIDEMLCQKHAEPSPAPLIKRVVVKGRCLDYNLADAFDDVFTPTAFHWWLKEKKNVPVLFEHKCHLVAGETLSFVSKEDGLHCKILLHDSPAGRDVIKLVECGAITALSIGCDVWRTSVNARDDNTLQRTIQVAEELKEVSFVLMPAGQRTMLHNTIFERESSLKWYRERLAKYRSIRWQIETREIKQMLDEKLDKIESAIRAGQVLYEPVVKRLNRAK